MKRILLFLFLILALDRTVDAQGLLPYVGPSFNDQFGNVIAGGAICTTLTGTSTPHPTYKNLALSQQNANPIQLNNAGEPVDSSGNLIQIFLDTSQYRITVYNSTRTGQNICNQTTVGNQMRQYDMVSVSGGGGGGGPTQNCSGYSGSSASDKIIACIAALPTTGGIADATGLEGAQSITTNILAGCSITRPITLLLGAANFSTSVTQTATACGSLIISGTSGGGGIETGTTFTWDGSNGGTVFSFIRTRDSVFEGFNIVPGTGTIGVGILSDNVSPAGSANSTNLHFRRISIGSSTTGVLIGLNQGDGNNAEHTFEDVYINGTGTYGYYVTFSQSRNLSFIRGSVGGRAYGIYHNNGSSQSYRVNFSGNTHSDFFFVNADDSISIIGCHSELSGMFLDTGGYSGVAFAAGIINNQFTPGVNTLDPFIQYKYLGPVTMIGNDFASGTFNAAKINISTNNGAVLNSIGNTYPNVSVFTGAVSSVSVSSSSDIYLDGSSLPHKMPQLIGGTSLSVSTALSVTGTSTLVGDVTGGGNIAATTGLSGATIAINGDTAQSHLKSGTYTPTLSNVANVSASSIGASSPTWGYLQVGVSVSIFGCISVTPAASGNVGTEVDATLPILNGVSVDTAGGFWGNPNTGLDGVAGFNGTFGNGNKLRLVSANVTNTSAQEYCGSFHYHLN